MPDLTDSVSAARNLLGWKLIHQTAEGLTSGYIVETEAYRSDDPASHTYLGRSIRNDAMFQRSGTIYVYFIYGVHHCVNIVTGQEGDGQGVLIRALEPIEGVDLMQKRRGIIDIGQLTNGPGKLTQAMDINKSIGGKHLQEGRLRLERGLNPEEITQTTRIGITKAKDQPWRFYITKNAYVSKR